MTSPEPLRLPEQSPEERLLYAALRARSDRLPPYDSLMVSPQPWVFVRGRWFRLDLTVTYRGQALTVEVDDPSHHKRYVADRSRDELVRDCGVETMRVGTAPASVDS